jgi:hypothetical protein
MYLILIDVEGERVTWTEVPVFAYRALDQHVTRASTGASVFLSAETPAVLRTLRGVGHEG